MNLSIDLDREEDGRWIAEVRGDGISGFPTILVYGATREEAVARAEAAALHALGDLVETMGAEAPASVSFAVAA